MPPQSCLQTPLRRIGGEGLGDGGLPRLSSAAAAPPFYPLAVLVVFAGEEEEGDLAVGAALAAVKSSAAAAAAAVAAGGVAAVGDADGLERELVVMVQLQKQQQQHWFGWVEDGYAGSPPNCYCFLPNSRIDSSNSLLEDIGG